MKKSEIINKIHLGFITYFLLGFMIESQRKYLILFLPSLQYQFLVNNNQCLLTQLENKLIKNENDKKNEDHRFEQRSRPLARKKLQDSIDRSPSVSYLNQGFSPDSLNNAVDRMIDDLVFDLADVDAFKKNKTIQTSIQG